MNDKDLEITHPTWGILFVSLLGLFLELLFIRWIGTEIRIFAYLQNTILVVCFLGLGLGMFTSSKPIRIRQTLVPMVILMLLMALPITRFPMGRISEMLSVLGDFVIWSRPASGDTGTIITLLSIGLCLTYVLLVFVVDIFVPIGRLLGRLMDAHPNPIWAYSVNIFGSIIGTWAFVLLSFYYQPPVTWFLVMGGLMAFCILWTKTDTKLNFALLAAIILLSWFVSRVPESLNVIWSPYQKLVVRHPVDREVGELIVEVNNTGYQAIIDLSSDHLAADPVKYPESQRGLSQYDLPALLHPNPRSALIVGSGTGNDVAGALRHNVEAITAVEIDPAIIAVGRDLHPEKPYASPNVHVVNDDARSFLANTDQHYDLISFGLLDSHTTTAMTNARLDHYVYTLESIRQAKSRLNDGGIMALSFEVQKPFIADRIRLALKEAFGQEPLAFRVPISRLGWGGVLFITGDLAQVQRQLERDSRLASFISKLQAENPISFSSATKITTDDWPYIYLESARIPSLYFLLIVVMVLLVARSYKRWEVGSSIDLGSRTFWHFFFLGTAFLLLEVENISKASVVLGNTWQVNAVIISGILGMALLANWIAYAFPGLPLTPAYVLLIGSCMVLYFVDLATFGFLPYFSKALVVAVLTSLPMLFSGIVYVRSFASTPDKSKAIGANLIGALTGGLLQSITFITGIKALVLIVAVFYLLSLLAAPRDMPHPLGESA